MLHPSHQTIFNPIITPLSLTTRRIKNLPRPSTLTIITTFNLTTKKGHHYAY